MSKLLLTKDYMDVVEDCENQRYGSGLKTLVDDFIKLYQPTNGEMISRLMECVVKIFPDFSDLEVWNFQKWDMIDFEEEAKGYQRPQLQYLYSYLIHLSETEEKIKSDDVQYKRKKVVSVSAEVNISSLNSFATQFNEEELLMLCDLLIKHRYIAATPFGDFKKIFNAVPVNQVENKIHWIKYLQEGNMHNKAFFFFLYSIIPEEDFYHPDFCEIITHCFVGPDGQELTLSGVEKAYRDFDYKKVKQNNKKPIPNLSAILEPFQRIISFLFSYGIPISVGLTKY